MTILPVNQMIQQPNYLGSLQQGLQFGQQQRQQRELRADQQQLRALAPQVIAGDPAAFGQAAAIDPAAAGKFQGAGDSIARRAEGLIKLLEEADTANPEQAQALWQTYGVPFARQFSQGAEPTTNWAEAKPMVAQLKARIEMAKAGQDVAGMPTGFRELDMKARAAGLRPGTPEYQQAMNIALGREGRAATGGFGFEKVIGADGRERMGRANPRTGLFEIYDEASGNFTPMGGTAPLNGGQSQSGAPPAAAPGAPAQPIGRPDMELDIVLANEMIASGIPEQQVDAFLQARGARASTQTPTRANPALGVSQSPTEKAFATETGQQAAQLQFLPQQEAIKTRAAIEQAAGTAAAKGQAEAQLEAVQALPRVMQESGNAISLIDKALSHPGRATATGLSSRLDPRNLAPGTDATNFRVLLDQIKGGTFLQAFQLLKGGGAITQVEGQKAEQAIARLDTAQSDSEFETALRDLRKIAESAQTRAQDRVRQFGAQPQQAAPTSSGSDIDALLDKYR